MDKYIENMPKAELHCHLDGSVPLETLKRLAVKKGLNPKIMDSVIAPDKNEDLKEYLKSFDNILAVLQTKENLTEATYDLIKSVSQENVRYIELRFAPLLHTEEGLSVKEVIASISEGAKKGTKDFNIYVNLLVCCMRHDSNEVNAQLISDIDKINDQAIVAFDFAGNEPDYANETIEELTELIHESKCELILHSGECGCAHNVVQAIKLGAKRIGHGVAVAKISDQLKSIADQNVHFELCPTSNYQTNAIDEISDLPLKLLLDNKVSCSINTDNRTVSNTNLTKEFKKIKEVLNLSNKVLYQLSLNAVHYSFASDDIKQQIKTEMDNFYEQSNMN